MTLTVAPARERGLKLHANIRRLSNGAVAPARERGLKCLAFVDDTGRAGRSREGAWIEISSEDAYKKDSMSRSREGAWIEI